MKKIISLFLAVFVMFSVNEAEANKKSGSSPEQQKIANLKQIEGGVKTLEGEMLKNRDVVSTVSTYHDNYLASFRAGYGSVEYEDVSYYCHAPNFISNPDNIFVRGGQIVLPEFDKFNILLKQFSEPNIDYKCFTSNSPIREEYTDQSDECILMRRNTHKSSVCYYNYKKYLPENTKIKTDKEFLELVEAYYNLRKEPNITWGCENLKEVTSAEREKCKENEAMQQASRDSDVIAYLEQISTKSVPHCRKTVPKEYKSEFLKPFQDAIDCVKQRNALAKMKGGVLSYWEAGGFISCGGLYVGDPQVLIRKFEYQMLCSTTGFEKDLKY